MRAIRALFNKAIERNVTRESLYPFKTYKISKLIGKDFKRALDFEEIMIINLDLTDNEHLITVKIILFFSFYTKGMNFMDMMCLNWIWFEFLLLKFLVGSIHSHNFVLKGVL
jgi:hypothetical protein